MASEAPTADRFLDVRGALCPVPTVKASLLLEELNAGQVLALQADDTVTKRDLPGWCQDNGHQVMGIIEAPQSFTIYIRKG